MKLQLSKIDKLVIGIGALFIILLIVYAQFFSLSPLKSDLDMKEQALSSQEKLLDIVSQKQTTATETKAEDTRELQKKVPVLPLQEQVLLDLEKAETVSNSQIKTMGFSKDADVTLPTTDQTAAGTGSSDTASSAQQTTATQGDVTQAAATNQGEGSQDSAASQPTSPAAPSGMKKLTVQLSVESPTYQDFEKFIETLESFQRIVVVEAINYSGGEEITSLDQETKPLSYTLTVSAFYMPTLTDLETQTPKIDAPAPAGKLNPLTQSPTVSGTQP
jgi:type IV pilus assembly protein PilO